MGWVDLLDCSLDLGLLIPISDEDPNDIRRLWKNGWSSSDEVIKVQPGNKRIIRIRYQRLGFKEQSLSTLVSNKAIKMFATIEEARYPISAPLSCSNTCFLKKKICEGQATFYQFWKITGLIVVLEDLSKNGKDIGYRGVIVWKNSTLKLTSKSLRSSHYHYIFTNAGY